MLKVRRGDTATIVVNLFVDNVAYSPAAGERVVFTVKEKTNDAGTPPLIQHDVVNNQVRLTHEDTKDLDCGIYPCDVRVFNDNKTLVYTPLLDELKVCEVVNCDL